MGRAVELHIKTLPILEGTVKHEDLGKITTLPCSAFILVPLVSKTKGEDPLGHCTK